jgi:hypothetical protein
MPRWTAAAALGPITIAAQELKLDRETATDNVCEDRVRSATTPTFTVAIGLKRASVAALTYEREAMIGSVAEDVVDLKEWRVRLPATYARAAVMGEHDVAPARIESTTSNRR